MLFENEMMDDIEQAYRDLDKEEFVEEYNRLFGTNLTIDDVNWE